MNPSFRLSSKIALFDGMRILLSLIVLLFVSPGFAELGRWQNWEVERNDLQLNSAIYHPLPTRLELESYQTEKLYVLEVDPALVDSIAAGSATSRLREKMTTPDGKIKFYIHPKALDLFKELIAKGRLREIKVKPTTSPRTFFVDDLMIKVSLPQKINGAIRTIYPLQMSRATMINDLLGKIPGFLFLPEPLAFYDKTPNSPFGFIVREIPHEILRGETTLVPLLSYVADDPLGSLMEKDAADHGMSIRSLVETRLIPALVESFKKAARAGIALEAHQQNILLEIDAQGSFTGRIFYRDLDGARVDFKLRQKLGFHDEALLAMKDAAWIFDLENLEKMRSKVQVPQDRPAAWSPVIESAFKTYLVGSSLNLLAKKVSAKGFSFSIDSRTEREWLMNGAPRCHAVFTK